jgi:hypothetical protein
MRLTKLHLSAEEWSELYAGHTDGYKPRKFDEFDKLTYIPRNSALDRGSSKRNCSIPGTKSAKRRAKLHF